MAEFFKIKQDFNIFKTNDSVELLKTVSADIKLNNTRQMWKRFNRNRMMQILLEIMHMYQREPYSLQLDHLLAFSLKNKCDKI